MSRSLSRYLAGLLLLFLVSVAISRSALAAIAPPPPRRTGLEDVVHPNTILFLRTFDFSRINEDIDGTVWGKLRQHPEIAEFLDIFSIKKEEFIDRVAEESQLDRSTCAALLNGQVSLAFRGFSAGEGATKVYIGISFPKAPEADKLFQALKVIAQRMVNPNIPALTNSISGVPVLTLATPAENRFALMGNLLVITRDETGLAEIISRYTSGGAKQSLSGSDTFSTVARGAGAEPGGMFLYANTRLAMPVLLALTNQQTVELLDALGMPSVHGLGISASFADEGMRHTLYLHAPKRRTGILQVLSLEKGAEGAAASLPTDAGALVAARVNLANLYREVPRLIDTVHQAGSAAAVPAREAEPAMPRRAHLGLRALIGKDEIFGVPATEVLATLGDAIVLVPGPSGMAVRFDTADTAAFEGVIRRMEKSLAGIEGIQGAEFTSIPEGNRLIRYYNQSGQPVPLAPSYVVLSSRSVMVATHPQVLKAILRHQSTGTLASSPDFRRVMGSMPEGMGLLFYVDSAASYGRVYDALMPFANALTAYPELTVDPGLLPPGNELSPYFFGTAVGVHNSAQGLTVTSYSPCGLGGVLVYGLDRMVVNNPATMSVAAGVIMHLLGLETDASNETAAGAEAALAP